MFARCEALRLPVLLHPLNTVGGGRLAPYYLSNLLGNPFDTAIAAAHLIFGGVLDRHPRLPVLLPHAGGALPYLAGRLQRGQKVRPEAQGRARRPVTAYLKRFTYDTISYSEEILQDLIRLVGAERIMMGSDYCFDIAYEEPVKIVTQMKSLSAEQRTQILWRNAARLLKL